MVCGLLSSVGVEVKAGERQESIDSYQLQFLVTI